MQGLVIFAKNIQRVSAFYQNTLALRLTDSDSEHTLLADANTELVIHSIPQHIADNIDITDPPSVRANTAMKPVFHVQSLDAIRAPAIDTGGGLNPTTAVWKIRGARVLDGWDPEGNVVQFKETVDD